MLKALKFVQGSIAKKDFIPSLTHVVIEYGRVRGYNGVIGLSSPIPFDITCKPEAQDLIRAIAKCEDTIQLGMTSAGRLSVKSGKFKVLVNCITDDTPHVLPEGDIVNFDGEAFFNGIKAVAPFMGEDASRRWAQGVLVKDQSFFATNNIILVQYWTGIGFPKEITLPRDAVREMLRIGEAPLYAQLSEGSITFHYSEDRWLRTQLYDSSAWPNLGRILDQPYAPMVMMDQEIFLGLESIKPFVNKLGQVFFDLGRITTTQDDEEGASYDIASLGHLVGCYNVDMLLLLKDTAQKIDWTGYPGPVLFMNGCLRGAIIGMRA